MKVKVYCWATVAHSEVIEVPDSECDGSEDRAMEIAEKRADKTHKFRTWKAGVFGDPQWEPSEIVHE